jgi:hypothetical protein
VKILKRSWWMAPIVSFHWLKAVDLAKGSDFDAALAKLRRIRRIAGRGDPRPLGGMTTEYYALMGHILYSMGDDAAALEAFKAAIAELEEASGYSEEEKKYLLAYITGRHERLELPSAQGVNAGSIDLGAVRPGLKLYFPLEEQVKEDLLDF